MARKPKPDAAPVSAQASVVLQLAQRVMDGSVRGVAFVAFNADGTVQIAQAGLAPVEQAASVTFLANFTADQQRQRDQAAADQVAQPIQ